MRHFLPGLLAGLLFGAGLAVSDMINPARVLAFLDVAGAWDPSLAFVMAGALLPSGLAYLVVRRMERPLMAAEFRIPQNRIVDRRLLGGAALFGIGWGMVGLCPGPAVAALGLGLWQPWLFGAAMAAGMLVHRLFAEAGEAGSPLPRSERNKQWT
jgi:uncharacterized membrane protein YedE/YeeE